MSKNLKEVRTVRHVDMWRKSIQEERITKGPKAAMPSVLKEVSSRRCVQATGECPRRKNERKSGQRQGER